MRTLACGRDAVLAALLSFTAVTHSATAEENRSRTELPPAIAIAPGDTTGFELVSGRCPTFHWGAIAGAAAIELTVYQVPVDAAGTADPEVVRQWTLPGSATGYTPPLSSSLERGASYAWTLRARRGDNVGTWAAPRFFEIPAAPSQEELAAALEVLAAHLRATGSSAFDALAVRDATRSEASTEADRSREHIDGGGGAPVPAPATPPSGGVVRRASAAIAAGNPNALLKVAGEVRTIDPDDPDGPARIWGSGRVDEVYGRPSLSPPFEAPCELDGIHYGLSHDAVEWGSAAAACPAGTWVCRGDQIAPCNTLRPDGAVDGRGCDGTAFNATESQHLGWLADAVRYFNENGGSATASACWNLPVWCCWDPPR